MEHVAIELTVGQRRLIGEKLEGGEHADLSAYVAHIVRLHTDELLQERLERLLIEGLNSGPGRPLEDVMRDLRARRKKAA